MRAGQLRYGRRVMCVFAAMACAAAGGALAAPDEFRTMWATRFEWPSASEAECKTTIDEIMAELSYARFNAVFFQVRGQADVLYPSPYEVWSPLIGGQDPGWDPLAYAIDAAHALGLEFHAYINTHTCWHSDTLSLPPNPNHVFYQHCNAADPQHRDWLNWNDSSNPQQFYGPYVWFAPGVPAYQAYIRQQVLYVVENYDVDGVHFDRIRSPTAGQASQDPISLARYYNARTNPDGLNFTQWTADQITRTVQDLYAAIMAAKPQLKVSAAVFADPYSSRWQLHQDSLAWADAGAMDMLVPMMYSSGGEGSAWDDQLQTWLGATAGDHVHIVPGHITSQGLDSLIEQVELARLRGAAGNSAFSWGSFWGWYDYRNGVYAQSAARPAMPWKTSPANGIIYGHVSTPDDDPQVDAQVRLAGRDAVGLSGYDGFYSFLEVPPGTHTVTATHPYYAPAEVPDIVVTAGSVVHVDLPLPPKPVGDFDNDGAADLDDVNMYLRCMYKPGYTYVQVHPCSVGDADEDDDVDLQDFAVFQVTVLPE